MEELAAWSRYGIPGHGAWAFINDATGEEVSRLGELGTEGLIEMMDEVFGIAEQPG
jgi:hypothetical protein